MLDLDPNIIANAKIAIGASAGGVVRTFDLTIGQMNRIGINAAVGDTITLETYAIYADKGGFGV